MKIHITILLAAFTSAVVAADGDVNLRFKQTSVSQALLHYSALSGLHLTIAPAATNHTKTVTLDINPPLPKKEAAAKIATALREQAGVVITPTDDKRASVTRAEK